MRKSKTILVTMWIVAVYFFVDAVFISGQMEDAARTIYQQQFAEQVKISNLLQGILLVIPLAVVYLKLSRDEQRAADQERTKE